MGYRAAELLISRLESKKRRGPRVELRLPAELKIKGSTSQKVGD
jgi:DNA-binding LacI/PurR family transcriptional regulator